jgi:hypothetical protein
MSFLDCDTGTSMQNNAIENLLKASAHRRLSPFDDLPWEKTPSRDEFWLTPELISIYGQPEYEALTLQQRKRLSQLEFCLLCSVSASGEKEVVANMMRRMLKARYASFRRYFHFFVEEENNHIRMFAEFCERHGQFYPVLYPYVQSDLWKHAETEDLLTFVHILIFEELGQGLNEVMMHDERLPPLVRAINGYHVADEGRHISFGRMLVREHAPMIKALVAVHEWRMLQEHVLKYLQTRHIDYHNLRIYREVGLAGAPSLRERLINANDERFFAKSSKAAKRIASLIRFLAEVDLMPSHVAAQRLSAVQAIHVTSTTSKPVFN